MHSRQYAFPLLFSLLALGITLTVASGRSAELNPPRLGQAPYMGWSSWSLQATKYPGYGMPWLTDAHIRKTSDAMRQKLQSHGYNYINLDSGWASGFDANGCPAPDLKRFPEGMAGIAKYVHGNGQKFGIYWIPGIGRDVYEANPPIEGTSYRIRDIVKMPLTDGNAFGDWHLKIDYSKPGAQEYIDSIVRRFAAWGVDFLKLDGVAPGSDKYDLKVDNRADVAAYAAALRKCGRPIWLTVSWKIDPITTDLWKNKAHARRIDDDIETYGEELVAWEGIRHRFTDVLPWAEHAGPDTGWNDFDSVNVGVGQMDGLTPDERRTMMTFWAIGCSPLYAGDDLTKLDDFGIALLTNREVIAVNQRGHAARQYVAGKQQVWVTDNGDGSYIVGLFNLDNVAASVTAEWDRLGLIGKLPVRDLWQQKDLGDYQDRFRTTLAPHACRLIRMGTPDRRNVSPRVPTGLSVTPGDKQTRLTWKPVPGATAYIITRFSDAKREKGETVTAIVRGTIYTDQTTANGTRYFYTVGAMNGPWKSLLSPAVMAIPHASDHPLSLGIDFVGQEWAMGPEERAGVVPTAGWNSAYGSSGTLQLRDSTGETTGATLRFGANGHYRLGITDRPGKDRLMRGYIEAYDKGSVTVTISDLPPALVANGYDVYVYCDGANEKAARTARYTIGAKTVTATDGIGSDFKGVYRPVTVSSGNYLKFTGLKNRDFVLKATPFSSTDKTLRAPINAIQIIARPKTKK